jgi:diguanylate cyclase (GGDEF)-like protein
MRFLVCCALLLGLSAPVAQAMDEKPLATYSREVWTTRDGLPHNLVNGIAQTKDGYLWFATWEGVVRYNGQEFRVFGRQNVPELEDNGIRSVSVGKSGALVLGTSRGGVTVKRGEKWQTYTRKNGLSQDEIMAAIEDRAGRLWVATESAGINRISNGQVRVFGQSDGLPEGTIYSLTEDGNGAIWASTRQGLARIEGDRVQMFGRAQGMPPGASFAIQVAPKGGLYVGTEHGVYFGENGRFRKLSENFPDEAIPSLQVDGSGALWIGTVNRGLMRWNGSKLETFDTASGLPNNRVASLLADREGSLWVGTNAGLLRFADTPFITIDTHTGLSDDYVRSVIEARDGSIWIGTARGLDHWQDGVISAHKDGSADQVLSLEEDRDGSLWVGTYSTGLVHWINGAPAESISVDDGLPGNQVRALTQTRDGALWIGTSTGLVRRMDGKMRLYTHTDGLPRDFIMALHEAHDGTLWIGTANGLAYFKNGKITQVPLQGLDDAQDVFGIHEDGDGTLWLATDRGLIRRRDGKMSILGVTGGLPVTTVFQVVTDNYGNFWLTSNSGVIYLRRDDANAVLDGRSKTLDYQQFAEADGMASAQCNGGSGPAALRARDGAIWVATAKGVAVVQPDQLARYQLAPPDVVIEGVRVDGLESTDKQGLVLPPGTKKLELDYVSLSYRTPEQIRYRYRLEGFDNNWVERNQLRNAQYTNLAPGRYTFKVSAALRGSGWSPETASLNFEIQPRFYQRAWFLPLAGLVLALVLYGLYRARVASLEAKERELSSIVADRTRDLSVKNDQLENLNHTIRQQSEAFEVQARTDALTSLANRRSMDETLARAFAEAVESNEPLCFALLDIDHFKLVNDGYSHEVGDQALQLVSKVMLEVLGRENVARWRGDERIARWGGEEFALLFPNQDIASAFASAERLRRAIELVDCNSFAPGLRITVSIGLAERTGLAHHERLVSRADQKLYEAKNGGRNRVVM